MNRTGRRQMLIIGIIFNVIGIIILQVAQNWKIWLVGKLFNSMGFGMVYCMSPVWSIALTILRLIIPGLAKPPRLPSVAFGSAVLMPSSFLDKPLLCKPNLLQTYL